MSPAERPACYLALKVLVGHTGCALARHRERAPAWDFSYSAGACPGLSPRRPVNRPAGSSRSARSRGSGRCRRRTCARRPRARIAHDRSSDCHRSGTRGAAPGDLMRVVRPPDAPQLQLQPQGRRSMVTRIEVAHAMRAGMLALACVAAGAQAQAVDVFSPQGEVKGVRQVARALRAADGGRSAIRASSTRSPSTARKRAPGAGPTPGTGCTTSRRDLPAGVRCRFTREAGPDRRRRARRWPAASASSSPPAARRSSAACRTRAAASTRTRSSSSGSTRRPGRRRSPPTRTASPPASTRRSACASSRATSARPSSTTASRSRRATCACVLLDADAGRARALPLPRCRPPAATRTSSCACATRPTRRWSRSPARARCLPGAEVKLVWGKGIAATTGVATDRRRRRSRSRCAPPFRASFTCERVNKDAQCMPHPAAHAVVHRADRAGATRSRSGWSTRPARRIAAKLPKDDGQRHRRA